jgi:hypothetical protein
MTALLLIMFAALVAAGLVALYVAYPHRGQQMPVVPAVGEAMRSAADAIPLVDGDDFVHSSAAGRR